MEKDISNESRFAVLIDADNISEKYIKAILDEISNYGTATYKRIYGDWTKPNLGSWKNALLKNSITPIQQYGYTTGKNATDSAMIIDAMDILYSKNVDGFCLVSSDSDFTRLASRLREGGMKVVGMGEKKTPEAFIAACNQFKYLEVLAQSEPSEPECESDSAAVAPEGARVTELTKLSTVKKTILTIIDEVSDEDQWAFAGDIGRILQKRYPDFDQRNYGCKKFTQFLRSLDILEVRSDRNADGNKCLIYVRAKQAASAKTEKQAKLPGTAKAKKQPSKGSRKTAGKK